MSLSANGYFIDLIMKWQDAWLEQVITTSEIETILRKSSADTTYEGIVNLLEKEGYVYKIVSVTDEERKWLHQNHTALLVNDTKFIFSNGQYAGSTANLPKGIKHWGAGDF